MKRVALAFVALFLLRADMYPDGSNAAIPAAGRNITPGQSVFQHGSRGDAKTFADGVMTAGSAQLCSASTAFSEADVGKVMQVDGAAGAGQPPLVTTIQGYVSAHCVTLAASAVASMPLYYAAQLNAGAAGTSGSYVPGEQVCITGGTSTTQACATLWTTKVRAVAQNANGSGGTNGACTLTGTSGTAPFRVAATVTAGAISAIGAISNTGHYSANPASLAAEPVTGCGLTGATVTLTMGADVARPSTPGNYSAVPASPVATAAGATSGATGATFTVIWTQTGSGVVGTDDTAAFAAAISAANAAGSYVYLPAGNYLINGDALPVMTGVGGVGIRGEGSSKTNVIIGAGYSGDLFAWSQNGSSGDPLNGVTHNATQQNAGPIATGFSVSGNRLASARQNALMFFDWNDKVFVDDVAVFYVKGSCLSAGTLKTQTYATMRESEIRSLRCENTGMAGVPSVLLTATGAVDATNEVRLGHIRIYAPYGPGITITNGGTTAGARYIKADMISVEGLQNNSANIAGNLMDIGGSTTVRNVSQVEINQLELLNPYPGFYALQFDAGSLAASSGIIRVASGIVSGGAPMGGGVNVKYGLGLELNFSTMDTWGTDLTISANTVGPVIVGSAGTINTWTISNAALAGTLKFPALGGTGACDPVAEFGADPSGAADSTAAINQCLALFGHGQNVRLPVGNFKITNELVLSNAQTLSGAGRGTTQLVMDHGFSPSATAVVVMNSGGPDTGPEIRDVGFIFYQPNDQGSRAAFLPLGTCNSFAGGSGCKYPPAILMNGVRSKAQNIRISKAWKGIVSTSAAWLNTIEISAIDTGLDVAPVGTQILDWSHYYGLHFWPFDLPAGTPLYNVYNDGTMIAARFGDANGADIHDLVSLHGRVIVDGAAFWGYIDGLSLDADKARLEVVKVAQPGLKISNMYTTGDAGSSGGCKADIKAAAQFVQVANAFFQGGPGAQTFLCNAGRVLLSNSVFLTGATNQKAVYATGGWTELRGNTFLAGTSSTVPYVDVAGGLLWATGNHFPDSGTNVGSINITNDGGHHLADNNTAAWPVTFGFSLGGTVLGYYDLGDQPFALTGVAGSFATPGNSVVTTSAWGGIYTLRGNFVEGALDVIFATNAYTTASGAFWITPQGAPTVVSGSHSACSVTVMDFVTLPSQPMCNVDTPKGFSFVKVNSGAASTAVSVTEVPASRAGIGWRLNWRYRIR